VTNEEIEGNIHFIIEHHAHFAANIQFLTERRAKFVANIQKTEEVQARFGEELQEVKDDIFTVADVLIRKAVQRRGSHQGQAEKEARVRYNKYGECDIGKKIGNDAGLR